VRLPACLGQLKPFFIPMVHSPSGAVGHLAAPELPSQEGRAPRRGTRGSTGAPLSGRQSPEPWDTWQHRSSPRRRQGPELRDMWQRRSSPQQGSEVRGRGTCGGAGAHLCREVWSEGTTYVAVRGCTSYSLSLLRACMWGYLVFRVPTATHSFLGRWVFS
jgi:hypothetical protein